MFAITEVGARQCKVAKDEVILIPRVSSKKEVVLNKVLMLYDGKDIKVGTPYVNGAKVVCNVISDAKGPKTIAFKYRRRKNSQRIRGHRDLLSKVKIKEIIKGE
ncbi:MAG: 50S ribosomal protein L21 [Candidatus Omnitrophica bacterium]|nr:50S ribosomal protein L21 [Candidatus Omnitrophota bacterium]